MLTIVVFQRVDHFFYTRSPILRVYLEMESIDYVKGLIRTIRIFENRRIEIVWNFSSPYATLIEGYERKDNREGTK